MSGLNHGNRYKRNIIEQFPLSEGVFKSSLSNKWVVRVKDTHNPYNKFRSLSQARTEGEGEKLFNEYKNNLTDFQAFNKIN